MAKSTRLGDGELEVMQAIWEAKEPVSAGSILDKVKEKRTWGLSTLMTVLGRLIEKGYLSVDKTGGTNIYTPVVSEKDYKNKEGRSFLEKVYGNSLSAFVASLYDGGNIKKEELEELRRFIESAKKEE
ncbi:MAG: BlaI/MecI/CopY family transcriptional regulator [Oscillospiraceae bacterium]|nr:BlaI/MecI/CopY family transcriptional regulator [Oscillospiraceae bacterium]